MQISPASFLLGLFAGGMCVGGAAFLYYSSAESPRSVEAASLTPSEVRSSSSKLARSETPDFADSPSEERTSDTNSSARPLAVDAARVDRLVSEAKAAVEGVERKAGEGVIWGSVRDLNGNPLEGVVVRAHGGSENLWRAQSPDQVGGPPPPLDALEETVRKAVESYANRSSSLAEARTDASGSYRIEGLAESNYSLQAYKNNWRINMVGRRRNIAPGSEVHFEGEAVVQLAAAVYLPDGSLAEKAMLRCEGGASSDYTWTKEAPYVRLTAGHYNVEAFSEPTRGARGSEYKLKSKSQALSIEADVPVPSLRFELEERRGIQGRLAPTLDQLTGGDPRVYAMPLAADGEPDLIALAESDQNAWVAFGDEFAFFDLSPGMYVVGAARTYSCPIEAHALVEVREGVSACELKLPEFDPTQFLMVSVFDDAGRPLHGVDFYYRHEEDNSSRSGGAQALFTKDKRYAVSFDGEVRNAYFSGRGANDKFSLEVRHERHGSKTFNLVAGQRELQASFGVPARLEVTVLGFGDSPRSGRIRVELKTENGDALSRRFDHADQPSSEGKRVFEAVEPGSYHLELTLVPKGEQRSWGHAVHSQPITLQSGENAATLAIPILYEVIVAFPDGEVGSTMNLHRLGDHFDMRADLDENLSVVFAEVPAGRYQLGSWTPYSTMEIEVPCAPIQFVVQVPNALRVTIDDSSGKMAQFGLLNQDLIIGLDGTEFETEDDFSPVFRARKAHSLILLRAGSRVEMPAMELPWKDGKWQEMGGSLMPISR